MSTEQTEIDSVKLCFLTMSDIEELAQDIPAEEKLAYLRKLGEDIRNLPGDRPKSSP
jgi:hypothetical protein